ncbi:MAG: anti-sigma factor antagonist [Bacteroidota bacterium]|jgi:anti-sigma B factor antagonist
MDIITSKSEEYLIIEILGDLDASSSMQLDSVIAQAIQDKENKIIVNCKNLNYISSAGLGVFMSYIQDFRDNGIFFSLYDLSEKVRNVFNILGLEKLIPIYPSESDAKAAKHIS